MNRFHTRCTVIALALFSIGGCPSGLQDAVIGALGNLGSSGGIVVEVYNDTNFTVDPHIRYDESDNSFDAFLAGVFGGDELATGRLAAGEYISFRFDCDELGLVFSDGAEQRDIFGAFADARVTEILRRDKEFDCGDTIVFQFIGDGDGFGVVVSVNGLIVD